MIGKNFVNFMGLRHVMTGISLFIVIASLVSLSTRGLVFGLDFTGGTQIEVGYQHAADLGKIRSQLSAAGLGNPVVVNFGTEEDVLIKMQGEPQPELGEKVVSALGGEDVIDLRRIDYVGPQVGEELRDEGGLGMLASLLVVMLYVAIRFQYKFSIGAVVALIHDVIITLGVFSIFKLEFDLTVLAAVLAVVGYSLNDTIIVFDRIRENFRLMRKAVPLELINESINQTLARTLATSFTTLLVLFALFFVGGDLIHNFSIALLVGIGVGTYSSIYVASNLLLLMKIDREDLVPPVRAEEVDELP